METETRVYNATLTTTKGDIQEGHPPPLAPNASLNSHPRKGKIKRLGLLNGELTAQRQSGTFGKDAHPWHRKLPSGERTENEVSWRPLRSHLGKCGTYYDPPNSEGLIRTLTPWPTATPLGVQHTFDAVKRFFVLTIYPPCPLFGRTYIRTPEVSIAMCDVMIIMSKFRN